MPLKFGVLRREFRGESPVPLPASVMAPRRRDWPLRAALVLTIGALLATDRVATAHRPAARALTAVTTGTVAPPASALPVGTGANPRKLAVTTRGAAKPAATKVATGKAAATVPVPGKATKPVIARASAVTGVVTGAVTGRVVRPEVGGGCGLALGRQISAPVGHCTVLEIGDSLGNDIGWGLVRHVAPASGLNLVQLDRSATGLANSSYYDWPAVLLADLRRYHPQLVLICLGGNDEQGMMVDGSAVQFPAPAWKSAYLARARQLVSDATAGGAYVLWVGMPIMQQPSYSQGMQVLNSIYRQAVTSEPDATFLSTWSLFSGPQGTYQPDAVVDGTPASLRQPDGIHYSFAGEDVIATYVLRKLAAIYHVRLVPTDPDVITGWQ